MKHIPNILTIIRFFLIPFILIFIFKDNYIIATIFLVISGFTDILDGTIARKFNFISDFGKLMDPLADKLTQISTLFALVVQGIVPVWIIVVVLTKEFLMIAGASFLYGKNLVVSSKWYGKLSTVLFYVAIFCSMIIRQFTLSYTFDTYIYYLAVLFTIFSLAMYFKSFYIKDFLKESKTNKQSIEKNKEA